MALMFNIVLASFGISARPGILLKIGNSPFTEFCGILKLTAHSANLHLISEHRSAAIYMLCFFYVLKKVTILKNKLVHSKHLFIYLAK